MEANDNNSRKADANLRRIKKALMDGSAPSQPTKRKRKPDNLSISVSGNGHIFGDGNNVTYIHTPPPEKKVVVVKAGDGTITSPQQAELKALVDEIVGLESTLRRQPRTFGAVWGNLNKKMKVTRYVEIPLEKFPAAKALLEKERALLLSMKSAPAKAPNWRLSRYRSINARAKEFPEGELRYRSYSQERFGTGSLKELSDDQLDAVYRHVYGWPRPGK